MYLDRSYCFCLERFLKKSFNKLLNYVIDTQLFQECIMVNIITKLWLGANSSFFLISSVKCLLKRWKEKLPFSHSLSQTTRWWKSSMFSLICELRQPLVWQDSFIYLLAKFYFKLSLAKYSNLGVKQEFAKKKIGPPLPAAIVAKWERFAEVAKSFSIWQ